MNLPRRAAGAGVLALSLVLTACGGGETTAPPGGGSATERGATAAPDTAGTEAHNDADVQFAQQMIVHHRGALAMGELAVDRADSQEVRALAEQISAAQ